MGASVDLRLLGPFEVVADGRAVPLGGLRQRAVLAVLALHANEVLSADRLADLVWNGEPPDGVRTTLQGYVFHLRKALAGFPAAIETRRPGYVLTVDPECIDVRRFERLVEQGRTARADGADTVAAARLREAVALWRGPALVEFADEQWAESDIARLEELRLTAAEERFDAELALGRHSEVVAELETFVRNHPLRETLRGLLMRALHGSGRTADALRVYQDGRTVLVEELGIDPGLELQRLERAILVQDPSVEREQPAGRRTVGNLPAAVTSFVGRERELADTAEYLQRARIVTLTGPGGSGKTRLALQAGTEAVARHTDGVWFVELSTLTDPALVVDQVATTLGVADDGSRPLIDAVTDWLRRRDALLIVDNCEHLLEAAADTIAALLRACPHLHVLATSREALGLAGELSWPVPALPTPASNMVEPAAALEFGSVRLFVDRARTADPAFVFDRRTATAVIDICRRLDGMPLALELAAARMRVLSVEQIASRLDDRFKILTGGVRGAESRQRTLRAAIDWSYETLSEAEQALFTRLSVFAGPFGFERAEAVGAGGVVGDGDVLDLLDGLVAKSLITRVDRGGDARFRLLETLRHYGLERLEERGELAAARNRHAEVLCAAAEAAAPELSGPDQAQWLHRLEDEFGDFRAALEWLLECNQGQAALRMAAALWRFWDHRPDSSEGRVWMGRVLAAAPDPTPDRLAALVGGAYLGMLDDDLPAAMAWCNEGIALAERLGDRRGRGRLLVRLAEVVRVHDADPDRAEALAREAADLLAAERDGWGEAQARWRLTLLAWDRGDLDAATALAEQCLALWDAQGDAEHAAGARALLAGLARDRGDLDRAADLYEHSLADFRSAGDPHGEAQMVLLLATVAVDRGDAATAADLGSRSLDLHEETGDARGIARSLVVLADAAFLVGDLDRAEALARAAANRMRERGFSGDLPLALTILARVALAAGKLRQAEDWCDEALTPYRTGGARRHAAPALVVQSCARSRAGLASVAATLAEEARELFDGAGDARGVARSLEALADAALVGGEAERAARYLSAARTTRERVGAHLIGWDLERHEQLVASVRAELAGTEFGRVWTEEWDEAVVDLTTGSRPTARP